MKPQRTLFLCILILLLAACSSSPATPTTNQQKDGSPPAPEEVLITQTVPLSISLTSTPTQDFLPPTPTQADLPTSTPPPMPSATLGPDDWKNLPVIPEVGSKAAEIFRRGQELGNDPHTFSKIGDCGSTPAWFLGDFDLDQKYYRLGEYQSLEQIIQKFKGSFGRTSLAAKSGFNASSIFAPIWSDPIQCKPGEAPLACEYRVNKPVIAFIMLGSNDVYHPDEFEPAMRKIIEYSIEKGIVPILSTKGDNIEGDGSINATIARLAAEYGIPLWNYWAALQGLPDKGLQPDKVHLTWGPNRFDDRLVMTRAWPVRNLTALQLLDAVWKRAAAQTAGS
jgi:hypothetical protein